MKTHFCNHLNSSDNNNSSKTTNSLNPSAAPFVPLIYQQDFDPNAPPKSYADVVNNNPQLLELAQSVDDSNSL